jgi:hypothetical protein
VSVLALSLLLDRISVWLLSPPFWSDLSLTVQQASAFARIVNFYLSALHGVFSKEKTPTACAVGVNYFRFRIVHTRNLVPDRAIPPEWSRFPLHRKPNMSNRIFQAVWDNGPETRTEMLVLMALADCADATSAECFPSLEFIARAARASRRAVCSALKSLEAGGWIKVKPQLRPNGSTTSNRYTIQIEKLGLAPLQIRGAKTAPPRGAKTAPPPVQFLHPTGGAKTAPPEQTIYNKEPAALNLDFQVEKLTAFQRSSLLSGKPCLIGGVLVASSSPQASKLLVALKSCEGA